MYLFFHGGPAYNVSSANKCLPADTSATAQDGKHPGADSEGPTTEGGRWGRAVSEIVVLFVCLYGVRIRTFTVVVTLSAPSPTGMHAHSRYQVTVAPHGMFVWILYTNSTSTGSSLR